MRWLCALLLLNLGLVLVCFGLMAQQNQCAKNLEDAFLKTGAVVLVVAAAVVVMLEALSVTSLLRRRLGL